MHLSLDLSDRGSIDFKKLCNHPSPTLFQKNIGYQFNNTLLLLEALTHSSFANELRIASNERLEFLGDTVLDLLVSDHLLNRYSQFSEGELSKFRGALVNEDILAQLALAVGLDRVILVGKGECSNEGYSHPALLADGYEALLGALYLDGGFLAAACFFKGSIELFDRENETEYFSVERLHNFDAKSRLQELTMALYKELPRYEVKQQGELFIVSLFIQDRFIDEMKGSSKKKATKELAQKVLEEKSYVT